jgi:L-ascorbate metabolism protein UlaG (beta-lactamase superfamily)
MMAILIILSILILIALVTTFILRLPQFGSLPKGERQFRIEKSPHFSRGQFQNLHHTPMTAEGVNMFSVIWKFIVGGNKLRVPPGTLPSSKTDLLNLSISENILVWFGHSSYFIQVDGKKILVDPVFSGNASPFSFTTKSFPGADIYSPDDVPDIDYLFITHDHWDHLDFKTVLALKSKTKRIITGLGVAAHFDRWKFDAEQVIAVDWNARIDLDTGFVATSAPARHFSGRGLKRNRSIWSSFILQTPSYKLYLGGDSGYDDHFAKIGKEHGPFDLAILECGQYDPAWKYIHMMPEETVQAGIDLKSKWILPVHWSKFNLSLNAWNDSIERVTASAEKRNVPLIHPMIGEKVNLNSFYPFEKWWEKSF